MQMSTRLALLQIRDETGPLSSAFKDRRSHSQTGLLNIPAPSAAEGKLHRRNDACSSKKDQSECVWYVERICQGTRQPFLAFKVLCYGILKLGEDKDKGECVWYVERIYQGTRQPFCGF